MNNFLDMAISLFSTVIKYIRDFITFKWPGGTPGGGLLALIQRIIGYFTK